MKSLRLAEFGPPSVLRIDEIAIPEPAHGEALVHVKAAAIIASAGVPRVSFSLTEFYHNFSRLLGVDSHGLTSQQVAEIEEELRPGFETGALKLLPIEIVVFEKAVEAYSRVAAGQAKAKQVLSFD